MNTAIKAAPLHLTTEGLATRLRAALRRVLECSSNEFFYDEVTKTSYNVKETLEALDAQFPVFTEVERAFIHAVSCATGYDDVEQFVLLRRDTDANYTKLENGSSLMDHEITFYKALEYAQMKATA